MTPSELVSAYVADLKQQGLHLTEEAVRLVVEKTFKLAEDVVKATPTPFDDLALAVIPPLKAYILPLVDKIDGKAG